MSLKDQITEDMKAAMRAKDSERLGTIRLLTAAMKQKEVDERIELDDAAVIAIVDKMLKQRKDSIDAFEKAGRQDLADKEIAEVKVLQAYLPARLSADEVAAEVKAIVAELGGTGSQCGPRRHGQSHGRRQSQAGRQGRHGPGLCRSQGSPRGLIPVPPRNRLCRAAGGAPLRGRRRRRLGGGLSCPPPSCG
jgi:uncharacterized protein YqeY